MNHAFYLQWHLTTACQNHCKHCYVYDPATYEHECTHPLSLEKKLEIMDKFDAFGEEWGFTFPTVCLIGGDPLLAPDWFEFATALRKRGKKLTIAGNPETLTDDNLKRLKDLEVGTCQLSLDGMEENHDRQRSKGSFRRTVEGLGRLKHAGISPVVMTTLTPIGVEDFFKLCAFIADETAADVLGFDFVCKVGNARGMHVAFTPEEVFDLSVRYLEMKETYEMRRPAFTFAEKPGFFRILHMARGEIAPYDDGACYPVEGCLIGTSCIPILSDGTLLSCRRLPEFLGRLPEDDIANIFLKNETLKRYRRPQFWKDCGSCIGWNWCRGCPSESYGECGDPFKKPSICYAHLLGMDTRCAHEAIPMETTMEEEADLIKRNLKQTYISLFLEKKVPKDIPSECLRLLCDDGEAKRFRQNPGQWFSLRHPEWSAQERRLFATRYNESIIGSF